MRSMLDPKRDLKGATPEKLARALFRRGEPPRPGPRRKAVASDEITLKEVPADQPSDRIPHPVERS